MQVALVTCDKLPDWELDDQPLRQALASRGAAVETPVWNDAAVDWSRFDCCLIRTTWDYPVQREVFLRWANQVASVSTLYNPVTVLRWNTVKTYLRDLADRGVRIAETIFLAAGDAPDLTKLLEGRPWRQAFLKPMIGASARETLPFAMDGAGLAAAQAHVDRLITAEGMMIQPFLESVRTEGEISVMFVDGHVTHAVRKVPAAGDYRVMDDFGATDALVGLSATDLAAARLAREAAEDVLGCDAPLLYARVDFLRDAGGHLVVNEVELVEPSFFFRHSGEAAHTMAAALLDRVS